MIEEFFLIILILVPLVGGYYLLMHFVYKHNTKQRYHKALNREILGDFKGAVEILLTCQTQEKYVGDKISELANKIREDKTDRNTRTVVYGDIVSGDKNANTEIRDSVINKSNIGSDKE